VEINDNAQSPAGDAIAAEYRDRSTRFVGRAAQLAKYVRLVSTGRLVAFCAAVACLVLAGSNEAVQGLGFAGCGLLLAGWTALMVLYERLVRRQKHAEELHNVNEHSLACMSRSWEEMRLSATEVPESDATLANDLDLFGRRSLFHFVCRATTSMGIATLRDWLLHPATPSAILERQQAVTELSPHLELRQELEARCRLVAGRPRVFLDWVEGRPWLSERPWLRRLSIVLGIVPSLSLALMLVSPEAGWMALYLVAFVNLLLTATFGAHMHEIFQKASWRHAGVRQYVALFDLMAHLPGTSSALAKLRQTAADQQDGGCARLRKLRRFMDFANAHTQAFKLWTYLPLQILFLWDFHVLAILEKWQHDSKDHARRWFEGLGELEALLSLAALAHDNPSWPFPTVDDRAPKGIEAMGLGHPLLSADVRVPNDVTVGPPGTFLLVTGSNMSGKTTLLRALGVNVVLAQAGAPVCAARLEMSPLVLGTVVHVDDSLVDGVSMFMAALHRLKPVVDRARQLSGRSDQTLIYLLDEVMRGTNSLDRRIAVRKILGHLLAEGAVGAISSHDVELASTESLQDACTPVHFRESDQNDPRDPRMSFDYKMYPGVATSTNALKLLKLVGLD